MQRGGNGERRRSAAGEKGGRTIAAVSAFENCFGQLLDKQRHAVGALDDLVDDFTAERGITGKLAHQRRAIAPAKAVERQFGNVRLTAPAVLKFGPEGDDE